MWTHCCPRCYPGPIHRAQGSLLVPGPLCPLPIHHHLRFAAEPMATSDFHLPPMKHQSACSASEEPAGRCELYGQVSAISGCVTGGDSDADSQDSGNVSERVLPMLPSIKESMPFLSSLKDGTCGKAGSGPVMPGGHPIDARDTLTCMHSLDPTPTFTCKDHEGTGQLPPLLPSSATPSYNSSPHVCPQSPPLQNPAKTYLKTPVNKRPAAELEGEVLERVGGQDWGGRRKRAKFEQTFQETCPKLQGIARLKLTFTKLKGALPDEVKTTLLGVLAR
jgi:hypothetical protein